MQSRSQRLGQQRDSAHLGEADRLPQKIHLVLAVAGGVRQHDRGGWLASLRGDLIEDTPEQVRREPLGAVGGAPENQRRRIAEPTLELASDARRLQCRPALGRVADQHGAVLAHEDD